MFAIWVASSHFYACTGWFRSGPLFTVNPLTLRVAGNVPCAHSRERWRSIKEDQSPSVRCLCNPQRCRLCRARPQIGNFDNVPNGWGVPLAQCLHLVYELLSVVEPHALKILHQTGHVDQLHTGHACARQAPPVVLQRVSVIPETGSLDNVQETLL